MLRMGKLDEIGGSQATCDKLNRILVIWSYLQYIQIPLVSQLNSTHEDLGVRYDWLTSSLGALPVKLTVPLLHHTCSATVLLHHISKYFLAHHPSKAPKVNLSGIVQPSSRISAFPSRSSACPSLHARNRLRCASLLGWSPRISLSCTCSSAYLPQVISGDPINVYRIQELSYWIELSNGNTNEKNLTKSCGYLLAQFQPGNAKDRVKCLDTSNSNMGPFL